MSEENKIDAWTKAVTVTGFHPAFVRKDIYGRFMQWADYGKRTAYGWEVDHITPKFLGGIDLASNYQALHWLSNRRKGSNAV